MHKKKKKLYVGIPYGASFGQHEQASAEVSVWKAQLTEGCVLVCRGQWWELHGSLLRWGQSRGQLRRPLQG